MLGYIRGKYLEIPIPNAEVTMNYAELIDAANNEKDALIKELRDNLEETTRKVQLEKKKLESDALRDTLATVPLKIYIG
jgi:thiamine monophosphate kinase